MVLEILSNQNDSGISQQVPAGFSLSVSLFPSPQHIPCLVLPPAEFSQGCALPCMGQRDEGLLCCCQGCPTALWSPCTANSASTSSPNPEPTAPAPGMASSIRALPLEASLPHSSQEMPPLPFLGAAVVTRSSHCWELLQPLPLLC